MTWMQTVDSGRAELRELNETYAARMKRRFREMERRFVALSFVFWATTLLAIYASGPRP